MGSAAAAVSGISKGGFQGVVGNVFGINQGLNRQANAATNAALEQQASAARNYATVESIVNPATVRGLADMDTALAAQGRNLTRQEQLVSQIDPTIVEASQQALRLLRGETASTLAPLQAQRDRQRQKLLNSLREQLGPGAETSTAGIQALTRFDSETDNLFSSAQQSAISNLGNTAGQFSGLRPNIGNEATTFGQLAQGRAGLGFSQANALNQASGNVYNSAGARYAGDQIKGAGQVAFGNQLLGAAIKGGTAALSGGASGAAGAGGAAG